ncbi:MAG: DUF4136 domain-containing protein [Flavobacteriales bacterium]
MRTPTRSLLGALLLTALLGAGCYPDQPDNIAAYDLVYTAYSPSYDFSAARTYSIPDSVVLVTGNAADGDAPSVVDPLYGDQIIARIKQNFNAYGWEEVNSLDSPDVIMLPAVSKTENVTVYNYGWGYWGGYYPGYYPGWGWYYPGYAPSYSSYTSGSLIMLMTDPNGVSPSNNVPIVWTGVVNGLLEGSNTSLIARIQSTIDEAFEQSSILKH